MQKIHIVKDGKFASSTSRSQQKIPVVSIEDSAPLKGSIAYNRESSVTYPIADSIYYANGTEWLQVSPIPAPGSITSVTAGPGIVGSTIGTNVVISMPNVGTAGTYDFSDSFTTDLQGRVSSVSTGFLTGSTSGSKFFGPATTLTNLGATALPWEYIYGQKAHIGLSGFTGVNDARLRLVGSANSINGGPNTEMYISSSVHPIKQTSGFSSGNISECYDCYYNGTDFVSSIVAGSSCVQVYKNPDNEFQINSTRSLGIGSTVNTISSVNSNAISISTEASVLIRKQISENGLIYDTGTVSQSGQIVTGTGTVFTKAMVGGIIIFPDGRHGLVISQQSATQLTVNVIQAVALTSFKLFYAGIQASRGSSSVINQYIRGSQTFVSPSSMTTIQASPSISDRTLIIPPTPIIGNFCLEENASVTLNSSGAIVHSFRLDFARHNGVVTVKIKDLSLPSPITILTTVLLSGVIPLAFRSLDEQSILGGFYSGPVFPDALKFGCSYTIFPNGNIVLASLEDIPNVAIYNAAFSAAPLYQFLTNTFTYMI